MRGGLCEHCRVHTIDLRDVSDLPCWPTHWVCSACESELLEDDADPREPDCARCDGGCAVCCGLDGATP